MANNTATANTTKLFTSDDLMAAVRQVQKHGFHAMYQQRDSIASESGVKVASFRESQKQSKDWRGNTILGNIMLEQTRNYRIDNRTQEERMLNAGTVITYSRRLVAFRNITDAAWASRIGTVLSRDFYLASLVTFEPQYDGQQGYYDRNRGVVKFERNFDLSIDRAKNEKPLPDYILVRNEDNEYRKAEGVDAFYLMIAGKQRAAGWLTDAMVNAAQHAEPTDDTTGPAATTGEDNDLPY